MKKKTLQLILLIFSISLFSSANQTRSWPGSIYFLKAEKKEVKKEEKKCDETELSIHPAAWLF